MIQVVCCTFGSWFEVPLPLQVGSPAVLSSVQWGPVVRWVPAAVTVLSTLEHVWFRSCWGYPLTSSFGVESHAKATNANGPLR